MERDFLGFTSKNGASTTKLEDSADKANEPAGVRGSSSSGMQWSFSSSNKVSAVPQLLSFKASQEDKTTTRNNINNHLHPIIASSAIYYKMTDAYDSIHHKPIFKRSVSMGTHAGNYKHHGMAVYSNNQSNQRISSSSVVLQSNVALSSAGISHNLLNSAIKPQLSLIASPSLLPSKSSIVGTTDLRNSSKSSPKPAQLTIFYGGSVCVYEDISPEKAQAIMLLAGNGTSSTPIQSNKAVSSPNTTATTNTTRPSSSSKDDAFIISQSYPSPLLPISPLPITFHAPTLSGGAGSSSAPNNNSHNLESPIVVASAKSAPSKMAPPPVGLPQARKASLARFLEKRKERVTSTSPYYTSKKSSAEGNTPRPDGISFSINSTTSCALPAIN